MYLSCIFYSETACVLCFTWCVFLCIVSCSNLCCSRPVPHVWGQTSGLQETFVSGADQLFVQNWAYGLERGTHTHMHTFKQISCGQGEDASFHACVLAIALTGGILIFGCLYAPFLWTWDLRTASGNVHWGDKLIRMWWSKVTVT